MEPAGLEPATSRCNDLGRLLPRRGQGSNPRPSAWPMRAPVRTRSPPFAKTACLQRWPLRNRTRANPSDRRTLPSLPRTGPRPSCVFRRLSTRGVAGFDFHVPKHPTGEPPAAWAPSTDPGRGSRPRTAGCVLSEPQRPALDRTAEADMGRVRPDVGRSESLT